MCGIFCTITYNINTFLNEIIKNQNFKLINHELSELCPALKRRGPDHYDELFLDISLHTVLQFAGGVLWTQGPFPMPQPLEEEGNVLLWNGDVFSGPLASEGNDSKNISNKLKEAKGVESNILLVLSSVRGPFSFIYYEKDAVGRHSLLIGFTQRNITISSVGNRNIDGFVEVPAVGIFAFDLRKDGESLLTLYPWSHAKDYAEDFLHVLPKTLLENLKIGETIQSYFQCQNRNVKTPPINDLEMWKVQDPDQSLTSLLQKITLSDSKMRIRQTMESLIKKSTIDILVEDLLSTSKLAVKMRVEKQPQLCQNCIKPVPNSLKYGQPCSHTKVAILFSGGLDCAVLSSLVHQFLPAEEPIDLLNVAFEKKQKISDLKVNSGCTKKQSKPEVTFEVPDRITGLNTLNELKTLHPNRKWNFVEINVSQEELGREWERVIKHLIYPLNRVLDESLGCALWFASRGKGISIGENEAYTSPARIILSGIGADEQLGGYMRHRTTLKRKGGWEALDKELQFELRRIWQRNLGRDDRIVSDHGRQLRMPYLDENVINYLNFLPPWLRCYPVDSMPPGVGDKLLLRLLAWKLGFRNAANLPKKAIQFGSRIANSREKADDLSGRFNS